MGLGAGRLGDGAGGGHGRAVGRVRARVHAVGGHAAALHTASGDGNIQQQRHSCGSQYGVLEPDVPSLAMLCTQRTPAAAHARPRG